MKKGLLVIGLLLLLIVGGVFYLLSGAGSFIKAQIEEQGSSFLGTSVSVANVDLAYTEGRLSISELVIANPEGFRKDNAFRLGAVTLDLGESINEPYVVQNVSINAPEVLYELDSGGKGNLIVIKDNLQSNLPASEGEPESAPEPSEGANPLVIVENVTVSDVRLRLNFENLPTGDLKVDTKAYEITLPTFNAGPIGKPNGIPADQVGAAIMDEMLDKIIAKAKSEAKDKLKDEAKGKLIEKAKDKLKGLFNKD
ncbi:hypothetical protein EYS14_10910 [Alteromonadaceae bacterium M269]|nr:hypothetical protein EYS14_10910 [Alteromonadaceae bacterium M269]